MIFQLSLLKNYRYQTMLFSLFEVTFYVDYVKSYTCINALFDTNRSYNSMKKQNIYIELKFNNSVKYKDCFDYRCRINSLISNTSKQLSLNLKAPYHSDFSQVTDNQLEYLGLVHTLILENCQEITKVIYLKNVSFLNLTGCSHIVDFGELESGTIHELILNNLDVVPGVQKLGKIKKLSLCYSKISQIDINYLGNVQELNLHGNKNIVDVSKLGNIRILDLSFCSNIHDVSHLGNVYKLILRNCEKITDVSQLGNVNELDLSFCINLKNISYLGNVRVLYLRGCSMISDVSYLGTVDTLYLSCCQLVTDVSRLGNVRKLVLYDCQGITDVSKLINVEILNLMGCKGITDVSKLINVKILNLIGCKGITDVSKLITVKTLKLIRDYEKNESKGESDSDLENI